MFTISPANTLVKGLYGLYKISNIPDGTSNTVAFTERLALQGDGTGMAWGATSLTAPLGSASGAVTFPSIGLNNTGYPFPLPPGGLYWVASPVLGTTPAKATGQGPATCHTAAIQVGLMDGSVRSVSSGVSPTAWNYAFNPSEGGTLDSTW